MKKVILASGSPRRHEILNLAGIKHDTIISEADETLPEGVPAGEAVKILSGRKAIAAALEARRVYGGISDGEFAVIGADTMVEADGNIFGKPTDRDDARRMLRVLSDSAHFVHTGVTVICGDKIVSECVTTKVVMRKIESDEAEGYIDSGEPFDKAGAYGIQGMGGIFVSRLEGDYYNVVGLPLCRVCEILREFGISPLWKDSRKADFRISE